ncbi:MAG: TRAP transporter small permease subunit [Cellvibrionaceae bacterium]|nr:TRAP transporter small permease subunit [Cellvibrionaceae bacterium]
MNHFIKTLLKTINQCIDAIGWLCVIALLLMITTVFINVFVRYLLIDLVNYFGLYSVYNHYLAWLGGIGMQELEKHWFALMFLLGLSYTLKENGHVRVDVFYDRFSPKVQALVNIVGSLIFTLPFSVLVFYYCWGFFIESWESGENRGDPGSLPRLWPFKLLLPLAFLSLVLGAVSVVLSEWLKLKNSLIETAVDR